MDPPDAEPQPRPVQDPRRKKKLTKKERNQIVTKLLWELQNHGRDGKFAHGTITAVALEFNLCTRTIRNVWARAMGNFKNPDINQLSASPQQLGRSGLPRKWNKDDIRDAVKQAGSPLFQRRTFPNQRCMP